MAPVALPVKVAVLDDYAQIAGAHFDALGTAAGAGPQVAMDFFPKTLNALLPAEHAQLIQRLKPYTVVSSMRERTRFPTSVLRELPNLKLLLTTGRRNAAIDMAACHELGITVVGTGAKVGNVAGFDATNEMTWTLILGLARQLVRGDRLIQTTRDGWQTYLGQGLAGKTLGLLGLGRLGAQAARTGILGFGMRVLAWSSSLTQEKADAAAREMGLPAGTFEVAESKDDLFRRADIVSIHYVLSDRSRGIVAARELQAMKPTAMLVNTSRGPLVDEADLVSVLEHGGIAGVGLDVFETEPLPADSPWRRGEGYWGHNGRSNVVVTPHMGYVEDEVMHAWYRQQVDTLRDWLTGKPLQGVFE